MYVGVGVMKDYNLTLRNLREREQVLNENSWLFFLFSEKKIGVQELGKRVEMKGECGEKWADRRHDPLYMGT
jgi:hypothetical protein